jgi:glycosyltransferase involved in cell wall biosynthesis
MRVLMAAGVPKRREGGVGAIVYNLARELEKRGHGVTCVFLEDLGDFRGVPQRFVDVVFALRLARYIRRNQREFTVVNIHAPCGFAYGYLRRLFGRNDLPPYVMTLQAAEERYAHAMRGEARKGRARYFRWKNRVWHRLYHLPSYHRSILSADYSIVANREGAAFLELHHHLDAGRVSYIPNGVDASFFQTRDYDVPPRRLLFVGTWLDRKGTHYLVAAFAKLVESLPNLRLTVAGCLVDESTVQQNFPEALHGRLDVVPFVPAAEMPRVYAAHDLFVFPSLVEGMPLCLLEAMASGMPVVTTDTCGMADVVEHERNGLLVEPADAEGIAEAVRRLTGCRELRERLGRAAQESMRLYTWDRIAKHVEKVFLKAADERKR